MLKNSICQYESGSALVEFVFVLGVLLPVGFGMTMLVKLTDLKQSAEQASRYSAWEATVYSRQALVTQQASKLEQRFFSAQNTPLSSKPVQGANAGQAARNENPLWGSSNQSKPGIRQYGDVARLSNKDVTAAYHFDTGKASAALATGTIVEKAGTPLAHFKGNSWSIPADGLLRSSVDIPVQATGFLPGSGSRCIKAEGPNANKPAPVPDKRSVCVSAAGVILADGWGASGDTQAASRVRSLVPGSMLNSVGKGVGKLLGATIFPELDPLDKAFGHVDMRVLPRYAKP